MRHLEKMTINAKGNVDQLSQNYKEMNETGREKLKEVSEKMLDIWNVVNEERLCVTTHGK